MRYAAFAMFAFAVGSAARCEEPPHLCGFDHVTRDGDHPRLYMGDWNMAGPGYVFLRPGGGEFAFRVSNKLATRQVMGKAVGDLTTFLPIFEGDVVQALVVDGSCQGVVIAREDGSLEFQATASDATLPGPAVRSAETIPSRN